MSDRTRAAAVLAAWSGDALGAIAHLEGLVESLHWPAHPNTRALWEEMDTLRLAHALACREVAEWRQRAEAAEARLATLVGDSAP